MSERTSTMSDRGKAPRLVFLLGLAWLVAGVCVSAGFAKGKPGPPPPPPDPAIAYAMESNFSNFDIMVANADGSNQTIVVPGGQGGQNLANFGPSWAPDGQWLAFCRGDDGVNPTGIYVSSLDGTDVQLVSEQPEGWSRGRCTSWSPDGEWIAFDNYDGVSHELFVTKVDWSDGTPEFQDQPVQLTDTPGRTEWEPSWAPDSSRLVATVFQEYGAGALVVFGLDPQPADPLTDCLYPGLPVLAPCVTSETQITDPSWMTFPDEGSWAKQHDWIAAGRVTYLDPQDGSERQGMFIIDISDPQAPDVKGPLGFGGTYFNSISWDPSDHVIAFHLQPFQEPGKHGNKTAPDGIYWSNLQITSDGDGKILGLSPTAPQLIVEGGAWAPTWRPCYPFCNN